MKNIRIEIKNETRIKKLLVCMLFIYCYLYLYDIDVYIKKYWASFFFGIAFDFLLAFVVFLIMRKSISENIGDIDLKRTRQYLYIVPLTALLFIPRVLVFGGFSDSTLMIPAIKIIAESLKYIFVTGVCEEFVYRVCIQRELEFLLGKYKIMAPFFAAIFFGFIHTVQGYDEQAVMAFGMGLILGYGYYLRKNVTFITIALAHGIFDVISAFVLK